MEGKGQRKMSQGAKWKMEQDGRGRTGKDDVCCKCGVMAERVASSRRRNWHIKWENVVR